MTPAPPLWTLTGQPLIAPASRPRPGGLRADAKPSASSRRQQAERPLPYDTRHDSGPRSTGRSSGISVSSQPDQAAHAARMRTTATATAPLTADATTECQPDAHVLQLERVEESTTEVHRMNATATNIMMPSITAEVLGPVAERPVQRTNRRRALRSAARPTPTICRRSSAPSMPPPIAPHRAGQLAASKALHSRPHQQIGLADHAFGLRPVHGIALHDHHAGWCTGRRRASRVASAACTGSPFPYSNSLM